MVARPDWSGGMRASVVRSPERKSSRRAASTKGRMRKASSAGANGSVVIGGQVSRGNGIAQPDTVIGYEQFEAIGVHLGGIDAENEGFAVPRADLAGGFDVAG